MPTGGGIIFSDSFNRPDGNQSGLSVDNVLGGNGKYVWTVVSGAFTLTSRIVTPNAAVVQAIGPAPIADVRISAMYMGGADLGLYLRSPTGAPTNGYFMFCDQTHHTIFRFDAGVATGMGTVTMPSPYGSILSFDAIGSTLRTWVNGKLGVTAVDATYSAAANVGFLSSAVTSATNFVAEHATR